MKKCLIVSTVSRQFTLFERGNIEVLKELGYEIHCVANYEDETEEINELGIIKHNIDIQRSPFSLRNIKAYKQLKNIINSDKYELIHCHSPMGGVLARFAARRTRKINHTRVIYTAHGFHFYKGAPLLNWILYYPIEKVLSKYTDCLITINQEDYEIASKKFKAKKVELINGIGVDKDKFDFEMTEVEKHKLRKSLEIKDDDFVIIYVAELSKRKNQRMLLEAVRELVQRDNKNIKVLLPGKDSLGGKYQKLTEKYNIQDNIKFLGFRNDIPKLMKISDLCVSTSKQEGLPVNIMEAMCCNLPIIATDCRGNRDLIQNRLNGYIVSINDVKELKEKILYCIDNKFCPKNNVDKYTKNVIKEKMRELYSNVLKRNIIMLRSTSIINDSRIMKEAKTFSKDQYDVKVLGWDRDGFFLNNKEFISIQNLSIEVYNKSAKYAGGMKTIFKLIQFQLWLIKKLLKYRNSIDIIHSCDFDTAIPAKIVSKIFKKKLVYDIFDYYIDSHYVPNVLKGIVEKAEIKVINNADLTIICTEDRKEQIKKSKPKRCIVIYNSPDIENYNLNKKIIKSDNNKLKIVYVGILQEHRLLKEIAEEIKNYPDVELHIGGFGSYENYFKKLSTKHSNIFYYGRMQYEDVLCLEKSADILFATYNPEIENHKYSAPNKIYEAMALEKPIIVCNNTGIDVLVKKEKIGYTIDYNAKEFVEKIEKFSCEEYETYSQNCKKIYNNKYNWHIMEKKLNKMIKEI